MQSTTRWNQEVLRVGQDPAGRVRFPPTKDPVAQRGDSSYGMDI